MSTVWHPPHNSLWLIVTLGLLSSISMVASAQTQSKTTTVRGYYCGESTGMHAGDFGFRVGNKVQIFHINFSQRQGNTKLVGFNPGSVTLGTEYTITYTGNDGNLFFADAVKSTGRMKDVLPCDVMQE